MNCTPPSAVKSYVVYYRLFKGDRKYKITIIANTDPNDTVEVENLSFNGSFSTVTPTQIQQPTIKKSINNSDPNQSQRQFKYGEVIQKSFLFHEAQRSGDLPNDNRIE